MNDKRTYYLCYLLLMGAIMLGGCQNDLFMNKYKWTSGISAARYYPAYIVSGSFSYPGGSAYIPDDRVLSLGTWGSSSTTHITGERLKPAPGSFDITWFCLAENQFYEGNFELPRQRIDSLFEAGFTDRLKKHGTFHEIVAGVAPGGVVIVWVNGAGDMEIEIGRYQAKKIPHPDLKRYMPSAGYKDFNDFRESELSMLNKEAEANLDIDNIPFGLWDKYRKRYVWKPTFKFANEQSLQDLSIRFYNGENFFIEETNAILQEHRSWAVPKYINPSWFSGNAAYGANIYMDEGEVYEAFQKLFPEPDGPQAELIVSVNKYNSDVKVYIENALERIELMKIKKELYIE